MIRSIVTGVFITIAAVGLTACDREPESKEKHTAPTTSADGGALTVALVPFAAGGQKPVTEESAEGQKIQDDPEQIAAGEQLYSAMNCVGCHFHGGGGMGPPLMDQTWIYGRSMDNIASSIKEGRPNGMPSFRGVLPDQQIWQIAAYVRSLSSSEGAEALAPN